ncbi:hypothetical protein ACFW2V_13930 [Streptomyces sp. NPDC058947]|uniref:hypothetical protein n=1 Tax=Streptomyces sp. NPDC058947 TaxID=3346675 RepID=UPI003684CC75
MSRYEKLVVDTTDLYNAYTAPEEARDRARDAWYRTFAMSGLTSLAGELDKDHRQDDGRWVLGWIVGEDEYYYYVIYDPSEHKVVTEKHQKAVKQDSGGSAS